MNLELTNLTDIPIKLASDGYAVVCSGSLSRFTETCAKIGRVTQTLDVKIKESSRQYANLPDRVPFHTDHPHIPTVAWHCVSQDGFAGASLLVDSRSIILKLSQANQQALTSINLRVFHSQEKHPLFTKDPFHIYWLPLVVKEVRGLVSGQELAAVQSIEEAIDQAWVTNQFLSIPLKTGESLFVNNQIMLHGRHQLSADSKRHLVRAYIS
jgi:Taurine catabolism dioxygenase TauD, TfdA family